MDGQLVKSPKKNCWTSVTLWTAAWQIVPTRRTRWTGLALSPTGPEIRDTMDVCRQKKLKTAYDRHETGCEEQDTWDRMLGDRINKAGFYSITLQIRTSRTSFLVHLILEHLAHHFSYILYSNISHIIYRTSYTRTSRTSFIVHLILEHLAHHFSYILYSNISHIISRTSYTRTSRTSFLVHLITRTSRTSFLVHLVLEHLAHHFIYTVYIVHGRKYLIPKPWLAHLVPHVRSFMCTVHSQPCQHWGRIGNM